MVLVVDNRRAEDADFWKVSNLVVCARNRGPEVHVPQRALLRIGVKGIDVVVQGHDVDHVVRPLARNGHVLKVKRLRVDVAADGSESFPNCPVFTLSGFRTVSFRLALVRALP